MNTICRLNWYNAVDYSQFYTIAKQVEKFLKDNDKLNNRFSIGNFCINGIPADIAEELRIKFAANEIDNYKDILEVNDIKGFKVGDKVKVFFENTWAQITEDKGTVYSIENNSITIKKYRSKTKGYVLKVGEVGKLELGW